MGNAFRPRSFVENILCVNLDIMQNTDPIPHLSPLNTNVANPVDIAKPELKNTEKKRGILNKISFGKIRKNRKVLIYSLVFLGIVLITTTLLSLNVYFKAKQLISDLNKLKYAVSIQDMNLIKTEVQTTKGSLTKLDKSYSYVGWLKIIPYFGGFVSDGDHFINAGVYGLETATLVSEAIEPYSDLLGFSGSIPTSGQETASDRIDFVIKTLPSILPKLDKISENMTLVQKEFDKVNTSHYPENFADYNVRDNLNQLKYLIDESAAMIRNGKPLIESAPYLLGIDDKRTYLVLFQNDKELRPTGGFLTAYSIMEVEGGKFNPTISDDIYNLDARYKPVIAAPDPIVDYIKGPYILSKNLRLRDMNWSPDFYDSMKLFTQEAEKVGVDGIDGVIAVDTQFLVNILEVLGSVGVSGFGNFSTEIVPQCNCPQVIYELESFADVEGPIVWDPNTGEIVYRPPNSDNRKRIIGPLMNAVLSNAFGQPKEKLPDLVEAAFKSLTEKHVLFYLYDDKAQKAVEEFGIAGRLENPASDYLHINDSNLGGRKSNMYVTQEVDQTVEIAKDGTVTKTLVITYKNPEKHDGWLNSVLPNWVRIYVPKGSELISFEGVSEKADPYLDLEKSVFSGYFELRPQGVAKVTIKYKLPFKVKDKYELMVQKQPGTDSPLFTFTIGKITEEEYLRKDKIYSFEL